MDFRTKISIVIPVYNVEKYLCECLDSILAQTFQDFEVICIDDGSEDNSVSILEEYRNKDDRFILICQNHSGAAVARNRGIACAKGKYIQFLDADDYFEPKLLEEMYCHAEKYGADITVCSARKVDDSGNVTESGNPNSPINLYRTPIETPFCPRDFKEDIFCLFNVPCWNKLYLKDFIVSEGLEFQNLTSCNDVSFSHISRICAEKIVVFNKELVNYRYGRCGSIAESRAKKTENIITAFLKVKEFLKNRGLYEELKNGYLNAVKMHISWEICRCSEEQYQRFVKELKIKMPDDWEKIRSVLKRDKITAEFLKNFIGEKKVMLWGASILIKRVLESEKEANPNILGIIDCNIAYSGKKCGNYTIYPPEILNSLKPDGVLLTVLSNNETIYKHLKEDFRIKYPDIQLLPNIFE